MDGTLITVDDGRSALRFERRLAHSPDRVWTALTDETVDWFVLPVDWSKHDVTAWEPPHRLAWNWEEERYSFELEADGDGCRLVFLHVFTTTYGPASQHAAGWETYLDRLEAVLGGESLSEEDAHRPIGELVEHYAARFGQDPRPARRMIASQSFRAVRMEDGPMLVVERGYRQPVERVWRALTDAGELAQWFPDDALEVVSFETGVRLEADWHGDRLTFELTPDGAGCRLRFTHRFDDVDTSARSAAGWDRCLAALDGLMAGVPMSREESLELWPEVHERYAEAFGVDPEVGRSTWRAMANL